MHIFFTHLYLIILVTHTALHSFMFHLFLSKKILTFFFPFSGVYLHIKCNQTCKIFVFDSKLFYKKL